MILGCSVRAVAFVAVVGELAVVGGGGCPEWGIAP
jgi:hypothetical protein